MSDCNYNYNSDSIDIIRQKTPKLIAEDICGVQPMAFNWAEIFEQGFTTEGLYADIKFTKVGDVMVARKISMGFEAILTIKDGTQCRSLFDQISWRLFATAEEADLEFAKLTGVKNA